MWRNTSIGVLLCITVQDHIFNCKLLYSPVLKHVWMEDPQFVAWYSFLINPIATNDLFHIDFSISLGQDTPTWISQSCSKGGTGSFIQPSATVPLNMHKISWHLPNVQHNGYYWIHQNAAPWRTISNPLKNALIAYQRHFTQTLAFWYWLEAIMDMKGCHVWTHGAIPLHFRYFGIHCVSRRQEASCMHLLHHHRVRPIIAFQTNLGSFPLKKGEVISLKKLWIKSLWGCPSCTSIFNSNLVMLVVLMFSTVSMHRIEFLRIHVYRHCLWHCLAYWLSLKDCTVDWFHSFEV